MQTDAAMMAKLTSALFLLPVEQDLQQVRAALQGLGTDLRSAKPTLPLIHALCVLPSGERTTLLLKLQARTASDGELLDVVDPSGSVGYVLKRLREHADQALETLRPLRRSRMKTALTAVPEWIVQQAGEGLAADSSPMYARHQAHAG